MCIRISLLVVFFILNLSILKAQSIIHVDATAAGANNGNSWSNAYNNLQDAIDASLVGDEIWIKNGVYFPTKDKSGNASPANNRDKTFFINKDIKIYGGFNGTESLLSQRSCTLATTTTLNGDIGVPNDYTDNTYHVVYTEYVSSNFLMDCITITGGYSELIQLDGAGWYNDGSGIGNSSNPTLKEIRFERNAAGQGGGMFNLGILGGDASPSYQDCIFVENLGEKGGAVNNYAEDGGNSSPSFINCDFDSNLGGTGGAIYNLGEMGTASPTFDHCNFISNYSASQGGAVINIAQQGTSTPSFSNCSFNNNIANVDGGAVFNLNVGGNADAIFTDVDFVLNRATTNGGAIYNQGASPIINNCLFAGDTAYVHGGAIYNGGNQSQVSSPTIIQTTFEGNHAGNWGGAVFNDALAGSSSTVFTNCKFNENKAVRGGAVANDGRVGICAPTFTNCAFAQNEASDLGGGLHNLGGNGQVAPTFINCSFSRNQAVTGGAMSNDGTNGSCILLITNSILWKNAGGSLINTAATITISHSNVESTALASGITTSSFNITMNPLFTNPNGNDLTLQSASPCIDAGNNASNTYPTDLAGNPRILGTSIDMGAYEKDPCPTRIYVDINATGANTGFSWADAFTDLQSALQYTGPCNIDTIWVAEGTYYPTSTTTRTISFDLPSGIKVFGGFPRPSTWPGNNPIMSDRDWDTYKSILSGDIGIPQDASDNTHNIVTASQVSNNTQINGFYIRDANANTTSNLYTAGGGIRHIASGNGVLSDLEVSNCRFIDNFARGGGGGIYNQGYLGGIVSIGIYNCIFDNNKETSAGGGAIYNHAQFFSAEAHLIVMDSEFKDNMAVNSNAGSSAIHNWSISNASFDSRIIRCNFLDNIASGSVCTDLGDPVSSSGVSLYEDCIFDNNDATSFSCGGVSILGNMVSSINRCKFSNNYGHHRAGAIYIGNYPGTFIDVDITNTLFYNNRTNNTGRGGAIYVVGGNPITNVDITNCTFAENFAADGGAIDSDMLSNVANNGTNINVTNSIFWGNTSNGTTSQINTSTGTVVNLDYCSLQGNSCMANNGGTGTINCGAGMLYGQAPLFVNQGTGDLHLTSSSPAINTGTTTNAPPDDLDGLPRPFGSGTDMGCYEFYGTIVNTNSIEELTFSIFPNPATDQLFIQFPSSVSGTLEVQLFDLRGRLVLEKTIMASNEKMDIPSSISSGVYFVKVIHDKEQIGNMLKLVKI